MQNDKRIVNDPILLSTWHFGFPANQAGWGALERGGSALDAVEATARHAESDPAVTSVGRGGSPDSSGIVTLDAAIMDGTGRAGAVACLRATTHAISVARAVMEQTPHVMLVGDGADAFARAQRFPSDDLLTEEALKRYHDHMLDSTVGKAMPNEERNAQAPFTLAAQGSAKQPSDGNTNHDTIGVIARDMRGNIAVACTTSGLAWKMPGRVGDSPIPGAGLFADATAGVAVGTGTGELIMKTCGSFLIVELMRQGWEPRAACEEAIRRIQALNPSPDWQAGYIALRSDGLYSSSCLRSGFEYAVRTTSQNALLSSSPNQS